MHIFKTIGIYDEDGLKISASVLTKSPDVYTFWNYRKRTLLRKQQSWQAETGDLKNNLKQIIDRYIHFIQHQLKKVSLSFSPSY